MSSSRPTGGSSGPEYLEHGAGAPLSHREASSGGRSRRRTAFVAGAGVLGLGLVGGGVWAAGSFFATGAQPAQALPDSTLGYVSIDLDPGGGQKIEALRTLRTFPAWREHVGLDAGDDVRRKIFEEIQQQASCPGLDYADDVEPWLGNRAAVAAVDTGAEAPTPVVVVQVTDEARAQDGLATLAACASDAGDRGGWRIAGGWAVLAETDRIAEGVVDDAAAAPLSDDDDFRSWSGKVGDAGIVSMYAAPAAGAYLADHPDGLGLLGAEGAALAGAGKQAEVLTDFRGAAATLRFADGGLELELAGGSKQTDDTFAGDRGGDVVTTLPADTAAAIGLGLSEGWFSDLAEQLAASGGDGTSTEDFLAMLSRQSGLDLPQDAETLAGESLAVSVGGDLDPEKLLRSADGSDVPVAAKVKGDVDRIESVLDKLRGRMGGASGVLGSDRRDDLVAVGPNAAYRRAVLEDGSLGSSDAFTRVVPHASDAGVVLFVDFDAGNDWLARLASGDPEVADNLAPLQALGMSAWQDGDTGHGLLRLTTD